jgi:putative transposase
MRRHRVRGGLWAFVYLAIRRLFEFAVLMARSDDAKEIELLALRHEVAMLRRQVGRPVVRARRPSASGRAQSIASPVSLGCFRSDTGDAARLAPTDGGPALDLPAPPTGTPNVDEDTTALVVRLASENPRWGYRRIQGELLKLGVRLAASTIAQIMKDARPRTRTTTQRSHVAGVPSGPGRSHHRHRLLLRRHASAEAPLRPVLHRTRTPEVWITGVTAHPHAGVGHPAGQERDR